MNEQAIKLFETKKLSLFRRGLGGGVFGLLRSARNDGTRIYKAKILLISILFILIGCTNNSQEFQVPTMEKLDFSAGEKYCFCSSPSFHEGFTVELDLENKTVHITGDYHCFFADSISKDFFEPIRDSITFVKLKDFLPKLTPIKADISESDFKKLTSYVKFLMDFQLSEEDMFPPCDGIAILTYKKINDKKLDEKVFYSPDESTKQGKVIINIFDLLTQLFQNDTPTEEKIENSQRYIEYKNDRILKVKSENPLYVKLLKIPFGDCKKLSKEVKKLPSSEVLYLDITNYQGDRLECIETIFRSKYPKIKLISREMFFFKGTPKNDSVMLNLFQHPLVKCTMQEIVGQARNDELNF